MILSRDRVPHITFEPLHADVIPPARATPGAAGYDLRAYLRERRVTVSDGASTTEVSVRDAPYLLEIPPTATVLVPLGFRARLPAGIEAQIRVRSSIAFRKGLVIPNAPGTIDADYPDEWLVMLRNASPRAVTIEHGERVAQMVLQRFETADWVRGEVTATTRTGGLGSTGRF